MLLTVPMALIGVFLTFWLTGASFTREAYVGSIMMAGIVVNNSILLVDRFNQLARAGIAVREAAGRAAADRAAADPDDDGHDRARHAPARALQRVRRLEHLERHRLRADRRAVSSTVLVLTVTPALLVVFGRRN